MAATPCVHNLKRGRVRDNKTVTVQRSAKKFVNLAKQDPVRARQNREARAGTNFSQPRTSLSADLCSCFFLPWQYPDQGARLKAES